ncbi:hypothetical protein Q8W71_20075 [Methylobacterium sp. NEAU 140]|uniref:hypothetical protein n=1 Tax=Methylobacterium sp. NEAU 140 TaxID=3064945 RepID=UPI00273303D8|nr:hypothetical protein [Methylobacterium sp. NEAU 140]MDP4024933.1 hypothetical protein [Methylobacterium sp. NEAU 140]
MELSSDHGAWIGIRLIENLEVVTAMKPITLTLIGAAALLGASSAGAHEPILVQAADCAFCAPSFIAVDPDLVAAQGHGRPRGWRGGAGGPFTRYDIEGIRRLTRSP